MGSSSTETISTGEKLRSSFQQDEIPNIKKQHLERVLVKKGMGFRNGESLSIENRSWGVSLSNWPEQKHWFSGFPSTKLQWKIHLWVWHDGKVSAGETQKLPYTKRVSLVNLELPKQFLKWGPKKECHLSFWGQQKKSSNLEEILWTLRSFFWIDNQTLHPWEESQFYRISLASRFAPSGAISSTDSHLPCVSVSKLPEIGDGHRLSYLQYL